MAEEPNKRMDEMLKGWARKKRQQPEHSIHPATRRLLQGEVARVYSSAPAQRDGWFAILRRFWPHLVFGGAFCLLLGVLLLKFLPGKEMALSQRTETDSTRSAGVSKALENQEADLNETVTADANAPSPERSMEEESLLRLEAKKEVALAAPPAPAPLAEFDTPTLAEISPEDQSTSKQPTGEPLTSPAISGPATARSRSVALKPKVNLTRTIRIDTNGVRVEEPASVSTGTAAQVRLNARAAAANDMTNLGAALRTSFTALPTAPETSGDEGQPSILNSFKTELLGDKIRFVDSDGSIYSGSIDSLDLARIPGTSTPQGRLEAEQSITFQASPAFITAMSNSAVYNFTVTGTNNTLQIPVSLQGQYFARTNTPKGVAGISSQPDSSPDRRGSPAGLAGSPPNPSAPAKAAIIGTAVVGGSNAIPIKALSTER